VRDDKPDEEEDDKENEVSVRMFGQFLEANLALSIFGKVPTSIWYDILFCSFQVNASGGIIYPSEVLII
jgi:hypothetical protein